MVQVPLVTIDTVVPLTVHTLVVSEEKVTVRPDVAVALTVKLGSVTTLSARAPKLIDCAAFVISNERDTVDAARKSVLPT